MPEIRLTLDTLQGGAARERFDLELQKVLKNIADPNTRAESKRTLTMKVSFEPSERREHLEISVEVSSQLAKMRPTQSMAMLEEDGKGGFLAMEMVKGQMAGQVAIEDTVPVEEPKTSNVREINAAGKAR
jgi:hypothetical protein